MFFAALKLKKRMRMNRIVVISNGIGIILRVAVKTDNSSSKIDFMCSLCTLLSVISIAFLIFVLSSILNLQKYEQQLAARNK